MTHNNKNGIFRKGSASRPLVTDPKDVLLFVENGNRCYAKLIVKWQGPGIPQLSYMIMSSNKKYYKVKEPQGRLEQHKPVLIYLKLSCPFLQQRIKDKFRLEIWSPNRQEPIMTKEFKVAIKNEKIEYILRKEDTPMVVNPSTSRSLTKYSIASRTSHDLSNSRSGSRSVTTKSRLPAQSARPTSQPPKKTIDLPHEKSIRKQKLRNLKEILSQEQQLLAEKRADARWKKLLCYLTISFICYLLGIVANVLTN